MLVGVVGIALALRAAASGAGEVPWPTWQGVLVSALCLAVTLLLSAAAWATLLGSRGRWVLLARGYLVAQLGKYVPGGLLQVAGQYDYARRAGVESGHVAVALPAHALSVIVSTGCSGALLLSLIDDHLDWRLRMLLGAVGLIGAGLATSRRVLAWILDRARRQWLWMPEPGLLPSQAGILRAAALGAVGSVCVGIAYSVMVGSDGSRVVVAAGYVVAFTVGFLVLPVPSGLGVREAMLVVLLEPFAPVDALLAAAVGLRVVQLVVELVLAGTFSLLARRVERRSREVPTVRPSHG
jgi:uncharacterized membrane protein YbhN (UPF0104 family)